MSVDPLHLKENQAGYHLKRVRFASSKISFSGLFLTKKLDSVTKQFVERVTFSSWNLPDSVIAQVTNRFERPPLEGEKKSTKRPL